MSSRRAEIESAARLWSPIARFIDVEKRMGRWAERRGRGSAYGYEFIRFGIKQGWACLFGGLMCALLVGTYFFYPRGVAIARYDFLLAAAVTIQVVLLVFKMETWEEAKVILLFHIVGTAMEVFKTHAGSWIYPEPSVFRIGGVPLFTGFMYAAVGSYLARVWRLFDFRFTHHPRVTVLAVLAIAIYVNFFAHHFVMDLRVALFAATAVLFGRTWVCFRVWHRHRRMPLLLGFVLVSLFIWFAENIGTATGTWLYPSQLNGWSMVPIAKLGSWFLLMIMSYVMVAAVHGPQPILATCEGEEGVRPTDVVAEAASARGLGGTSLVRSSSAPPLGVPAAGAVSRSGRPPRSGPEFALQPAGHVRAIRAAGDAARHGPVRSHLAGDVERLRTPIAGAAVLDPNGVAVGAVAVALLGHDLDAPGSVEPPHLSLSIRARNQQAAHDRDSEPEIKPHRCLRVPAATENLSNASLRRAVPACAAQQKAAAPGCDGLNFGPDSELSSKRSGSASKRSSGHGSRAWRAARCPSRTSR
jgi:uncharacterized membrane protein YoaT (DUF817 family)